MVTKGYRKGVYCRVTEGTWKWESVVSLLRGLACGWRLAAGGSKLPRHKTPRPDRRGRLSLHGHCRTRAFSGRGHFGAGERAESQTQARARGVSKKMTTPRRAGRGSRRKTCQTMKLIDRILRAGETANDSVGSGSSEPLRGQSSVRANCMQSQGRSQVGFGLLGGYGGELPWPVTRCLRSTPGMPGQFAELYPGRDLLLS